jgi:CRP-like cAMP-binding protein
MQRMILNNYSDTIRMHQIFFDQVGGRFKGFEHLFVPMLKPCFSERDQYLLKAGQSSRCMFFVEKGCCQLLTSQQQEDDQGKQQWGEEQAGERFKAGQSFGQASLLAGKRKSKVTMMCSVKTVSTFAHLLELSKAKFYSIKELCPALYDFLKQEWGQGLKVEDWVAVTNTASRSKKQKRASAGSEETATAAAATVGNVKQHTQQESEGPLDA